MKRFVFSVFVAALFSSITFISCSKLLEEENVNNSEDRVFVRIDFKGEVNVDESPMTRAFSSGDLLGIQVKEGSNYYAYGLFDDPSNVSLYLHSGKQYSFECCLVKNGEAIMKYYSPATTFPSFKLETSDAHFGQVDGGYVLPFLRGPSYVYYTSYTDAQGRSHTVSHTAQGKSTPVGNKFVYSSSSYFTRLKYGQMTMGDQLTYSKAYVFYGKRDNVVAGTDLSIPIELKSGSFGVKLSISGITDGNVTVTIKNSVQTFHTNSNISQDTEFGITKWCFYDLASAYQYADNYAENFTVGVVWNRGVGVTQDLGTKTVQFKRNVVNRVKINLGTATKSSGLSVELEEPEIINESYSFGN